MVYLFFALLGLVTGGVINVLADDLPLRRNPRRPVCHHCGHPHGPEGWLAIGRLIFHQGQCPHCGQPDRQRALYVELGTAAVFTLLPYWIPSGTDLFITAFYFAVLILIIVIDMEHRLILHLVTFPTTLAAFILSNFQTGSNSFWLSVVGALTGFFVFYLLYWLGRLTFGPGALGFGDVTLSMTMGAMLGFHLIFFALVIGILLGGIVSLLLIVSRRLHLRSRIPYGQFLASAAMIMLIWGPEISSWYLS